MAEIEASYELDPTQSKVSIPATLTAEQLQFFGTLGLQPQFQVIPQRTSHSHMSPAQLEPVDSLATLSPHHEAPARRERGRGLGRRRPENLARAREYHAEYRRRPENVARIRAYQAECRRRPEHVAKNRAYQDEHHRRRHENAHIRVVYSAQNLAQIEANFRELFAFGFNPRVNRSF